MKNLFLFLLFLTAEVCEAQTRSTQQAESTTIRYTPVSLSEPEKQALANALAGTHPNYDPVAKMVLVNLKGYNYHTDATSGRYHQVRASFNYANDLLDLGDKQYEQRAFDILEKCISLQDTVPTSKTYGIWGYYLEEPLADKKSPPDFNWADFNGVTLLEVWMGHQAKIPARLKPRIQHALILAAQSIQKRNITMSYTNIAIMGTYVTYLVSHLFDLADMQAYSTDRLNRFYAYTREKNGFSEYNSPAYTIIALDELSRMKAHIIEPSAKRMIDELYYRGWKMVATHYHTPSGQWAGPHSRAYSSLLNNSFYDLISRATKGAIDIKPGQTYTYNRVKHSLPSDLYPYFQSGTFPKTQTDVFEGTDPQIIGTAYMTQSFALATASRSSMWNQRRPFLAYWGTVQQPHYLQVRFLHDDYDFSSASFYSQQKENKILAGINLATNAGDKHISIDRITSGRVKARDFRLRFEFGKQSSIPNLALPKDGNQPITLVMDGLQFKIQLYKAVFDQYPGHWETGSDTGGAWLDYVIYSGPEKEFDLKEIKEAAWGFSFSMGTSMEQLPSEAVTLTERPGTMNASWQGLSVNIPTNVQPLPAHL
ncbi:MULTISPECIES: hypothetical protein [unclassified Spirosoma]|uniref:hypothetical protein n=1 Tax=unclassified Spirosoma TaxID=2621999 RepID=UPI00095AB275|nr:MULTISPECIES: hypothetical protein [unclassified Spirosoma]MBN8822547.1 hypothetical protein [Spirosoma sp.]OJW74045.1 MAG: hypothetical protein BGO59_13005 [Spirosoma sp. 48-14]